VEAKTAKTVIAVSDVPMLETPDGVMRDSVLVDASTGAHDMTAGIVWVQPNATIHEDSHDFDEVYYVIRGEAEVVIEDIPQRMEAGNVVLIPAHKRHHVRNTTDEVFQIFWCIATGWETLRQISNEMGTWPVVDATTGWHLS
jgi:mannose-6-phosphate isomerase-like protein (cupin superfamily)